MDNISIVIRVKNEVRWLGHCIQSCLDILSFPEIVVVDNNSTDESLTIARLFAHDTSLASDSRYTSVVFSNIDDYSPGRSLNQGVQLATRPYILIISAHCVLKSFNLSTMYDYADNYMGVFGCQTPYYFGKRQLPRYLWSHFADNNVVDMYSELEHRPFFHNALSFFKRSSLLKYPFDENLVGKEDRYWAKNIIDSNKHFLYTPDFSADHHYTDNGNTWKTVG